MLKKSDKDLPNAEGHLGLGLGLLSFPDSHFGFFLHISCIVHQEELTLLTALKAFSQAKEKKPRLVNFPVHIRISKNDIVNKSPTPPNCPRDHVEASFLFSKRLLT